MIQKTPRSHKEMTDIIQLLPDSVANQIAAGEVIQRPASVVKELIENAIDAEADEIILHIKDAGRTLVQVIDNGKGMSETDARMAFERHATSKIRAAKDLFSIHTMGFRGEALASIAAVADVELRTKTSTSELGTCIHIKGSILKKQETISCRTGSTFSVKNLFFNIPARRKFLKTDATEFKHILSEFKKTALAHPEIAMQLYHNKQLIHRLEKSDLLYRIAALFGRTMKERLLPVESQTDLLHIRGYTGKAETAKKRNQEQYFFVNKRFMKHPYFHKALLLAYEEILKPDAQPSYFLFFDINPENIDINIHPAKTEINFENASDIFKMLRATVRASLGKFSEVPSIDFDREGYTPLPSCHSNTEIKAPSISNNPSYNPFNQTDTKTTSPKNLPKYRKEFLSENWEDLYQGFESEINRTDAQPQPLITADAFGKKMFQYKTSYIVTPVKSGVMFLHIVRARERIFYQMLLKQTQEPVVQKLLYPIDIQLNKPEVELITPKLDAIKKIGFDLCFSEEELLTVSGVPAFLTEVSPKMLIEALIERMRDESEPEEEDMRSYVAGIFAQKASLGYNKTLLPEEMQYIVNELFALENPEISPSKKPIIHILKDEDITQNFK